MARFIAAVHSHKGTPSGFALVEKLSDAPRARYAVRRLHPIDGADALRKALDAIADEEQFTGHTTFVATGGQKAADAVHAMGPSAVPVTLVGDAAKAGTDVLAASAQVLVDTFERVYRDGDLDVPGTLDHCSDAVDALYRGADLDAASPEREPLDEGIDTMSGDTYYGDTDATATTVEQSGSAANVSTGVISDEQNTEMLGVGDGVQLGRVASSTGTAAPDLGDHADVALALALATWYGEYAADNVPVTDQADEVKR